MLDFDQIVTLGDKLGVVAFASTGVMIGIQKRLDIFGLLLVGVLSAIGGGILRDVMLSKTPYAITNISYFGLAFGASIITILLVRFKMEISPRFVTVIDSIGLGAFVATGSLVSLNANLSIFHTIFFAILTGVGGGMIRDILINRIPVILKRELYATVAGIGGLITHIAVLVGTDVYTSSFIGMAVTILFRLYAVQKKLNLPILNSTK